MIVVHLVIGAIAWPIITFSVIALGNKALMPFFQSLVLKQVQKRQGPVSWAWANAFQATVLVFSQIAVVLITKEVFGLFQKQATAWFAVPFGLWCLVCGILWPVDQYMDASRAVIVSRTERHIAWSWAVGLGIGWVIGLILLLQ